MTGQVAAAGVHCRSGSHVWRGPEQVTYTLGFRWCWAGGTIRSVRVRERFGDAEPGAFTASTALVGSGGVGSSYVSIGRQAHWHDFTSTPIAWDPVVAVWMYAGGRFRAFRWHL